MLKIYFQPRGYNILGPGDYSRIDEKWFFTLSYANGPGYSDHTNPEGGRQNPRGKAYLDPLFRQPTTVPEEEETHAGEDVGVFASGPFSHVGIILLTRFTINFFSYRCSVVYMNKVTSLTQSCMRLVLGLIISQKTRNVREIQKL